MTEKENFDEVLKLASELDFIDKVRLIEHIAPQIQRELNAANPKPSRSLRGLWRGLDITEGDITAARREMWSAFPWEDI
jgi:hypothetical protein